MDALMARDADTVVASLLRRAQGEQVPLAVPEQPKFDDGWAHDDSVAILFSFSMQQHAPTSDRERVEKNDKFSQPAGAGRSGHRECGGTAEGEQGRDGPGCVKKQDEIWIKTHVQPLRVRMSNSAMQCCHDLLASALHAKRPTPRFSTPKQAPASAPSSSVSPARSYSAGPVPASQAARAARQNSARERPRLLVSLDLMLAGRTRCLCACAFVCAFGFRVFVAACLGISAADRSAPTAPQKGRCPKPCSAEPKPSLAQYQVWTWSTLSRRRCGRSTTRRLRRHVKANILKSQCAAELVHCMLEGSDCTVFVADPHLLDALLRAGAVGSASSGMGRGRGSAGAGVGGASCSLGPAIPCAILSVGVCCLRNCLAPHPRRERHAAPAGVGMGGDGWQAGVEGVHGENGMGHGAGQGGGRGQASCGGADGDAKLGEVFREYRGQVSSVQLFLSTVQAGTHTLGSMCSLLQKPVKLELSVQHSAQLAGTGEDVRWHGSAKCAGVTAILHPRDIALIDILLQSTRLAAAAKQTPGGFGYSQVGGNRERARHNDGLHDVLGGVADGDGPLEIMLGPCSAASNADASGFFVQARVASLEVMQRVCCL